MVMMGLIAGPAIRRCGLIEVTLGAPAETTRATAMVALPLTVLAAAMTMVPA